MKFEEDVLCWKFVWNQHQRLADIVQVTLLDIGQEMESRLFGLMLVIVMIITIILEDCTYGNNDLCACFK